MENEKKPLILTTQMLLESALSQNNDVRQAAIDRIARELLNPESTLLKIIQLNFKCGFPVNLIYNAIAKRALDVNTPQTWKCFFNLLNAKSGYEGYIYLALIEIYKQSEYLDVLKNCHNFMAHLSISPFDEIVLQDVIIELVSDYKYPKFMDFAKKNLMVLPRYMDLIDYFTDSMEDNCLDDLLDLIKILIDKNDYSKNIQIFNYLINLAKRELNAEENAFLLSAPQKARMFELMLLSLDFMAQDKTLEENIRTLKMLLKEDKIEPLTAIKICEKLAKFAIDEYYIDEIFELVYLAMKKTPYVASYAIACLAHFEQIKNAKPSVLWMSTRIYALLIDNTYQKNFPEEVCNLKAAEFLTIYRRNVDSTKLLGSHFLNRIANLWLAKNMDVFWATVSNAPATFYSEILHLILRNKPEYFSLLCDKLDFSKVNKTDFAKELIIIARDCQDSISQDNVCSLLKNVLASNTFLQQEINDVKELMDGNSMFDDMVFTLNSDEDKNKALINLLKAD